MATTGKPQIYRNLAAQWRSLLEGERDWLANSANLVALLYHGLPQLNWAGCYFLRGGELVLGPFQGRWACTRIALGRGVCGTTAATRRTVLVANVHEFPGHIACDSVSNSEIVIPILKQDRLLGVLDLDSPAFNRFDAEDQAGLESLVQAFVAATDFDSH